MAKASAVAQLLDLARQRVFLLDGDPLQDMQPVLQRLHLLAQTKGLGMLLGRDATALAATPAALIAVAGAKDARRHDDEDDEDDHPILVHGFDSVRAGLSDLALTRAGGKSRSASIC